jgi:[ribosomal protein S18]-alanine N-acetyltransferase
MENNNVIVRPAVHGDADRLWNIECAASPFPWPHKAIVDELLNDRGLNLVAQRTTDGIDGFILSAIVVDDLDIRNIVTHPEFQRCGIARLLMETTLARARERGVIHAYLEVRSKNRAAFGLYSNLGFCVQSIRKNYYAGDGADAFVMHRRV